MKSPSVKMDATVEHCLLSKPQEITALLRELHDSHAMLAVTDARDGRGFISVITGVDPASHSFMIDAGGFEASVAADAPLLRFECKLDGVDVRFECGPANAVSSVHGLAVAAPRQALRLQRREGFRVKMPVVDAVFCRIPGTASAKPEAGRVVRIDDISCSGVALAFRPGESAPPPGTLLTHCRIDLPATGVLHTSLEVVDVRPLEFANGCGEVAGCRFVDLPGPQATLLQRYIVALQRERRKHDWP